MLWVFVSWAVFGISNTPAAAELTSPWRGLCVRQHDWPECSATVRLWLEWLTALLRRLRQPWLVYSWNIGDCFVWWREIYIMYTSWEWEQALAFTPTMYLLSRQLQNYNSSETGPDPSKINANSIRPDLIYCPGHARHQTSYQYLQPINNPLV